MDVRSRWVSILAVVTVLGLGGCNDGGGGGGSSSTDDGGSGDGGGGPTGGSGAGSGSGSGSSSLDVEWLHPRPAGGDYAGMAQGGGTYVVAGSEGRYLRSTDGQAWNAATFAEPDELAGIAFLDGEFVAIGQNDTGASVIYTSDDGQDWTRTESYSTSFTDDPSGIARDGSQYLVAGYDGVSTHTDLADPDGWTLAVDADKWLRDVACKATTGECVAVGNLGSSHTIHYLDGNGTWSEVGPTPADPYKVGDLHAVTWTGSAWVAVGDNSTILSSTDGQNWTERENYDSSITTWGFNEAVTFRDVAVVGSSLFAVGHYTDGHPVEPAVVLKGGTDGSGWSVVANQADWGPAHGVYADASGTGWVVGLDGDLHSTDDGGSRWADATTLLTPNYLVHLALDDTGRLIASGATDTLQRAADGTLDWFAGAGLWQAELVWDGQRFVAFPGVGSKVGVSTDGGASWTESDTGSCYFSGDQEALYNGDDFVVSSGAGVCLGNPTDGWALHETGYSQSSGSEYLNGIAFDGTTYVVVGNSGHLATSPDGANWTVQTTPASSELYDVAWTGSQFVAVGSDDLVMTSPAGSAWTEVSGLPTTSYRHIAADPGGGILLSAGGTSCYTGDTTLTACEEVDLRLDKSINDIAWHDGAFYAAGEDGVLLKLTP